MGLFIIDLKIQEMSLRTIWPEHGKCLGHRPSHADEKGKGLVIICSEGYDLTEAS